MHAYVEQMVRFYLGEEPILKSVPTYDPTQPGVLEMVLERIGELVIKPRTGHGGHGVVIGPHAKQEDLDRTAAALKRAPGAVHRPGDGDALAAPDRRPTVAWSCGTSTCARSRSPAARACTCCPAA